MLQNYPNPFNPSTVISFSVPYDSYVSIKIYNLLGEEINTLVNKVMNAGEYNISWNAGDISAGIYFYKFSAGGFSKTNKMILLR